MLESCASFEDGGNSVEAGIFDMNDRFEDGRLLVASHLDGWFDEYRMYHRAKPKDSAPTVQPKIVKLRDDFMAATRYGIMMLRHAETQPRDDDGYEYNEYNEVGSGGY